jgi:hypothetical protein
MRFSACKDRPKGVWSNVVALAAAKVLRNLRRPA